MKTWLPLTALLLGSVICNAQFNSIRKIEDPVRISLLKAPLVQDTTKTVIKPVFNTDEVEELKKAPKKVEFNSADKAEALIVSNFGASLPVNRLSLTSSFGNRIHPITKKYSFHTGIDLSARTANIHAVLHGSVEATGYNNLIGNFIRLTHGNYTTVYGHLSEIYVRPGELVKAGEIIGLSGNTGRSTGEHLHFTVKYKGTLIEPLMFLATILKAEPKDLYFALFK